MGGLVPENGEWHFRVWGLSILIGVQGSGYRVQGSGFRVQGPGSRVQDPGSRVEGPGSRVQCSGVRVQGTVTVTETWSEIRSKLPA